MAEAWTNEKAAEVITRLADHKKQTFESAKEQMARTLAENPVQAIEWEAARMVEAQVAYYEVWEPMVRDLAEHAAVEVVQAAIEATTLKVGWTLGGGSTCPFHRAVERVKGDVLFRELRDLKQMAEFHLEMDAAKAQS